MGFVVSRSIAFGEIAERVGNVNRRAGFRVEIELSWTVQFDTFTGFNSSYLDLFRPRFSWFE